MLIGSHIYYKKNLTISSMEWAKQYIHTAQHGSLFIADTYEHIRARHGRLWMYAPGQLIMTILLKPTNNLVTVHNNALHSLVMGLALGVIYPFKAYGIGLKWPNDFVLTGKKVGGMLCEPVWQDQRLLGLIFGFAINVQNTFSKNHPLFNIATSLSMQHNVKKHTMAELDNNVLQRKLCTSLQMYYQKWASSEFKNLYEAWKKEQVYLGKSIQVHMNDGSTIVGIMHDLLVDGTIILHLPDATQRSLTFAQTHFFC